MSVLENEWLWHDGSHLSWASWLPGQPNDWMGQDCLGLALMNVFSNVSTVFWNDLACERISHFMCEKEIFAGRHVCVGGGGWLCDWVCVRVHVFARYLKK